MDITSNKLPPVYIIVPVYNTSHYLYECILSCVNQTYCNIKVICIDDGSTDNSLLILKQFEQKFNNVFVYSKINKGVSSARNEGLKYCGLDGYITFVDSDDSIGKDYISYLMQPILQNGYDISLFGGFAAGSINKEDLFCALITHETSIGPYQKMIKSTLAKATPFHEELSVGEDLVFCYELFDKCDSFYCLDWRIYCDYTFGDNPYSLTRKPVNEKRVVDTFLSWFMFLQFLDAHLYFDSVIIKQNIINTIGENYLSFYGYYFSNQAKYKIEDVDFAYTFITNNKLIKLSKPVGTKQKLKRIIYLISRKLYIHTYKLYNA